MTKIRTNRRKRKNLRSIIACVTALSVVLGSSYFAMADDTPVYICGYTEQHTHDANCYGDRLICTTPEKLVYTCGQVDNGDGTVTYGEKAVHAHTLADCFAQNCETPEGHVHDTACYSETETQENWTCEATEHNHTVGCDYTTCEIAEEGHEHLNSCCTVSVHEHEEGTCYTVGPKLVCEIPENHAHTQAACYTQTCTQEEHAHADACTIADPVDGHKHGDACYEKNVLLCTKIEHTHTDACIQVLQSEDAAAVIAQIDALTLDAAAVAAAREAFDALPDNQEQFITNLSKLTDLEAKLAEVDEAVAAINGLAAKQQAVADAQAAKDAVDADETATEEAKTAAAEALVAAQNNLAAAVADAKAKYEALRSEQQALVPAEKAEALAAAVTAGGGALEAADPAVEAVNDAIAALPALAAVAEADVAATLAEAQAAKAAYDALTAAQQAKVEGTAALTQLITDLTAVNDALVKLAAMPTKAELAAAQADKTEAGAATLAGYTAAIDAAYAAYTALTEAQAEVIDDVKEVTVLYRTIHPEQITLGTVRPDVAKGVNVKVFNYDNSINSGYTLANAGYKFYNSSANSKDGSASSGGYNAPIMEETLGSDGYPVTTAGSMNYIFNGTGSHHEYAMADGGGLFQYDGSYFYYDSTQNAAAYNPSKGQFELYDVPVLPVHKVSGSSEMTGNFLPFNLLDEAHLQRTPKAPGVYSLYNTKTDLWFGMTVDFEFMMPKDGMMNGQQMVFNFSGDDDVFVYIDGKLVMDIGGCHAARTGYINFATGQVQDYPQNGAKRVRTLNWLKDMEDYSKHEFKFFYLERGGNISNCKITFNMPTLPNNSLAVGKQVEMEGALDTFVNNTQSYKFRVMECNADGSVKGNKLFIPAGTEYAIYENAQDTGRTGTVGNDGYFELRHNQQAVFEDLLNEGNKGTKYVVQEVLPADLIDLYHKVVYQANSQGGTVVTKDLDVVEDFVGVQSSVVDNNSTQTVTFTNKVTAEKLSTLEITKTATSDSGFAPGQLFDIQVMFGDEADIPLKAGTEYTVVSYTTPEGATEPVETATAKTVTRAGIIQLAAGEKAVITGILGGSKYTIKELGEKEGGFYATYTNPVGVIPVDATVSAGIMNKSEEFGVDVQLKKTAIGVATDSVYEFVFDLVQVDANGAPVENGTTATATISVDGSTGVKIETTDELDTNDKYVAYGNSQMRLTYSKDTPSGTYYYKVVERAHAYEDTFLPNDQEFIVKVVIDQDKDPRIQSVSVNDVETDAAVLNFINTNIPDVPVTVNKVWKVVENRHILDSVDVQLYVNGEAHGEVVKLSDANSWTHTWLIQQGDTWEVKEAALEHFTTEYVTVDNATTIINTRVYEGGSGGGGGGNGGGEEEGEVLGAEDIADEDVPLAALPEEEEEGMVLGAEDEEEGMVAGIADTGDSKAIIFAGAGMLAAAAGIIALRKRKED